MLNRRGVVTVFPLSMFSHLVSLLYNEVFQELQEALFIFDVNILFI